MSFINRGWQIVLLASILLFLGIKPVPGVGASVDSPGFANLLAPVFREVETGNAWVFPNSSFDLGARSMTCECFDPSGESSRTDGTRVTY